MKILHFSDAHIDIANYGRHDPETGLPVRVLDFLKSLDTIVDTAINERVDLVLFAGDAYKDRTPVPTFQREWGRRIMRLSHAGIPTLLLVGNHDLSPSTGRAHSVQEFDTLEIPHIHVVSKPSFLKPDDLEGLPLQILALPWVNRSGLMSKLDMSGTDMEKVYEAIEARLTELVYTWLDEVDPFLPVVLTAHCSVQGASYGYERTVMLGSDLVLSGSLVKDPRLNYVALGHIHKPQNLNEGSQPPVIYPGSIERVDFGEASDDKFFIVAQVESGKDTQVEWRKIAGVRPFIDRRVRLEEAEGAAERLKEALPSPDEMAGAIVRLCVEYQRDWETLLDEAGLREYAAQALEFHLVKRPQSTARLRLPQDQAINSLSPLELLEKYWSANHVESDEAALLLKLAEGVMNGQESPKE